MKLSSVLLFTYARGQAGDFEEKPDITDERSIGAAATAAAAWGGGGNLVGWEDIPFQQGVAVSATVGGAIGGASSAAFQKVDPWADMHKLGSTFGENQCPRAVGDRRDRDDCFSECDFTRWGRDFPTDGVVQFEELIANVKYISVSRPDIFNAWWFPITNLNRGML